ncbi:MAG: hypothetical protein A2075_18365 [Geobacteraceae bacterium GWC2_58_44]|nr:MAG: hypothetical protein A2075_18365 [Geobacteraceae bacterium GWC2_58_44]HBG05644.1 hypothetical protein [Geobacter sp.]
MKSAKALTEILYVARELGPRSSLELLTSRIFSINHYYILCKSLSDARGSAAAGKTELFPISEGDVREIENSLTACSAADRREILSRLIFYQSGFGNCYVMRRDNKVTFMQWIIYPTENGLIREKYANYYCPLGEKQVMIENAFTFPAYRGLGCLASGTRQLMELARAQGYRSAVCYIRKDRIAAVNEFVRMGFTITRMIPEYKVLGGIWRSF